MRTWVRLILVVMMVMCFFHSSVLADNGNPQEISDNPEMPLPVIAFDQNQKTTFKEGEEIAVTAYVSEGDFDSIIFIVNGQKKGVFLQNPATLIFEGEVGVYEVQAIARIGEIDITTEILTVNVGENLAPFIAFKGYNDESVSIAKGEVDTIELEVEDEDGIACILVYVNESFVSELNQAPYLVDISSLNVGKNYLKVVAVDTLGKYAEKRLEINICASINKDYLRESEFTSYKNNNTFLSGIVMYPQRGYVKTETVDEDHGLSLLVGIETVNEEYGTGNLPYINIPTGGNQYFIYECEIYVDKKDDSGDKKITLKKSGSTEMMVVSLRDKMYICSKPFDYETETWYRIRFDVDVGQGILNVYLNDEKVISNATLTSGLDCVDFVRLYGPRYDDVPSYTAIDNIIIKVSYDLPQIIRVGDGTISASDESFNVYLSYGLLESSVNKTTVSLIDENGNTVKLKNVAWNSDLNCITVVLEEPLKSNTVYQVVIDKKAKIDDKTEIEHNMSAVFITGISSFEITNVVFFKTGSSVTANVEISNADLSQRDAYVVLTVWNGRKFISKTIQYGVIDVGNTVRFNLRQKFNQGDCAQVYVYDSLSKPKMIANKIYQYN